MAHFQVKESLERTSTRTEQIEGTIRGFEMARCSGIINETIAAEK